MHRLVERNAFLVARVLGSAIAIVVTIELGGGLGRLCRGGGDHGARRDGRPGRLLHRAHPGPAAASTRCRVAARARARPFQRCRRGDERRGAGAVLQRRPRDRRRPGAARGRHLRPRDAQRRGGELDPRAVRRRLHAGLRGNAGGRARGSRGRTARTRHAHQRGDGLPAARAADRARLHRSSTRGSEMASAVPSGRSPCSLRPSSSPPRCASA